MVNIKGGKNKQTNKQTKNFLIVNATLYIEHACINATLNVCLTDMQQSRKPIKAFSHNMVGCRYNMAENYQTAAEI